MLDQLKKISPYDTLTEKQLSSLSDRATLRRYKKNMLIIHQGDDTDSLYIVVKGEMKVYVEDEFGKELTVRILKAGDSFGELALFGEFPRSANVMTLSDCSAFVVTKANYLEFIRDNPQISIELMKSLAKMVKDTTSELSSIALSDVYGRLVHILGKYADEQEGARRVPKFTHREIANMIGSSREMVSKIIKELEKGEYVEVSDKHYIIRKKLPSRW